MGRSEGLGEPGVTKDNQLGAAGDTDTMIVSPTLEPLGPPCFPLDGSFEDTCQLGQKVEMRTPDNLSK